MYNAIFYMKSGNVVELECTKFKLSKDSSGNVTSIEYEGGKASSFAISIDNIEAVKVVEL